MVSTKQDIVEWVLAAKEDPEAADRLINQYMGFIRAEAKKLSFGDGEDELSIAMFAFYEAVLGYERSRGNFLKFASKVIRSRLIDYHRAESRHRGHGSLNESTSEDGAELLELLPDTRNDIEELNTREAAQSEIEEYARALAAFGITFSEVADNCPKQERTLCGVHGRAQLRPAPAGTARRRGKERQAAHDGTGLRRGRRAQNA